MCAPKRHSLAIVINLISMFMAHLYGTLLFTTVTCLRMMCRSNEQQNGKWYLNLKLCKLKMTYRSIESVIGGTQLNTFERILLKICVILFYGWIHLNEWNVKMGQNNFMFEQPIGYEYRNGTFAASFWEHNVFQRQRLFSPWSHSWLSSSSIIIILGAIQ